jgi:hypothetical protein
MTTVIMSRILLSSDAVMTEARKLFPCWRKNDAATSPARGVNNVDGVFNEVSEKRFLRGNAALDGG